MNNKWSCLIYWKPVNFILHWCNFVLQKMFVFFVKQVGTVPTLGLFMTRNAVRLDFALVGTKKMTWFLPVSSLLFPYLFYSSLIHLSQLLWKGMYVFSIHSCLHPMSSSWILRQSDKLFQSQFSKLERPSKPRRSQSYQDSTADVRSVSIGHSVLYALVLHMLTCLKTGNSEEFWLKVNPNKMPTPIKSITFSG